MKPAPAATRIAPVLRRPQSNQAFDLDRPLREARDEFDKSYFESTSLKRTGT
jgi:hypothetical protein